MRALSTPPAARRRSLGVVLALLVTGAVNPVAGQDINPFGAHQAKPAPVASTDAELSALEFRGVAQIGERRSFNFTDTRTQKSFWLAADEPENEQGFAVVSYDPKSEQVVVRRGANTRAISLRKAVLVAAPGSPVVRPTPVVAANRTPGGGVDEIANPKTPEEIKQAEYEARMLVSDLLDISMKAREEQRKRREAERLARSKGGN